uniref:Uncharacterized protein n=1 Tax=Dulem virus 35 TaxID=3145753 RepID=A0AAU8AZQ3_9CAUD
MPASRPSDSCSGTCLRLIMCGAHIFGAMGSINT